MPELCLWNHFLLRYKPADTRSAYIRIFCFGISGLYDPLTIFYYAVFSVLTLPVCIRFEHRTMRNYFENTTPVYLKRHCFIPGNSDNELFRRFGLYGSLCRFPGQPSGDHAYAVNVFYFLDNMPHHCPLASLPGIPSDPAAGRNGKTCAHTAAAYKTLKNEIDSTHRARHDMRHIPYDCRTD